jgi:hypothetical protein
MLVVRMSRNGIDVNDQVEDRTLDEDEEYQGVSPCSCLLLLMERGQQNCWQKGK